MSDCCSTAESKKSHPKKRCCPANGIEYHEVAAKTIMHHINEAWKWKAQSSRYFFCSDPACHVVYFGDDETVITRSQLRTRVGVKEDSNDAPVCYCFGVSKGDAINDPGIKTYVMNQTKQAYCSCEVSNPSGRCCLKDFPKNNT